MWLILSAALMFCTDIIKAAAIIATFAIFCLYYRFMTYKHFKGVSGDTAGYFVTVSETSAAVILALITLL